ncbi:MAG: hypothetical protein HY319_00885 [Armatimonadetes bacterium]|nr:hypothetical protein [Armatimonadota bacterium]
MKFWSRVGLLIGLTAILAGCGPDPREAQLVRGLEVVRQAVLDPELRNIARKARVPADAAGLVTALFSPHAEAYYEQLLREVPPKIAVLRTADLPWSIVLVPRERTVRLEAYAAGLERPWRVLEVPVPQ